MGSSSPSNLTAAVHTALAAAQTPVSLVRNTTCFEEQSKTLRAFSSADLFPAARNAAGALTAVLLRLGCWGDAHELAQDDGSPEGSYWHAVIHRMEPDDANAAYWFRRVGTHPIFRQLHQAAQTVLEQRQINEWQLGANWEPQRFLRWCADARRAGGTKEAAASEIAQCEWQLLFDWCLTKG